MPDSPSPRGSRRGASRQWAVLALLALAAATAFGVGAARTATVRMQRAGVPSIPGRWRDGEFEGWGRSRHGRILATVTIRRGRIRDVAISACRMRYPCSMIATLPAGVVASQRVDVDLVSGASDSSRAFLDAVSAALVNAGAERSTP